MAEGPAGGRATFHVNGVKYATTRHAVERCEEMGFHLGTIATILREGKLRQHTPKSAHYRDGKGWIAQWQNLALGLIGSPEQGFTIVTMLWRKLEQWQDYFDKAPETDRERRPMPAMTMTPEDDIKEQG